MKKPAEVHLNFPLGSGLSVTGGSVFGSFVVGASVWGSVWGLGFLVVDPGVWSDECLGVVNPSGIGIFTSGPSTEKQNN